MTPRWAAAAVSVALLLGGCTSTAQQGAAPPTAGVPAASASSGDASTPAPTTPATTTPGPASSSADPSTSTTAPEEPVPASLRFTGTTTTGQEFDGADLRGRPVLLWFWAPWCPTCRSQLPEVNELATTYQGKLQVVAVGSLDSADAISGFADDIDPDTVRLSDTQGSIWKHFRVTEQSSYVVLDAEGTETFRSGYGGSADLVDEVAAVTG